ncbi:uncharacterized protein LOC136080730 isoform X2 [Hydra vulgaris]|uniref:Uncharacterized protein LOC136080730 isoform X2 n=1 Tax=Hydra vulgaris TaxID=6087 RepID=A0ABM4BX92_HYDVU
MTAGHNTSWSQHKLDTTQAGHNTNWSQHKLVTTQAGHNTSWSQHKLVATQAGHNTSWSQHKLVSTQVVLSTLMHCVINVNAQHKLSINVNALCLKWRFFYDLLVTRALLSLCVIFLCLALVMTFLSRVYNGRYRDFTTATVLFANVLKVAALLLYYSKNRVYTDFNYHCALGYSYLLGWLSFSILVFATTLSILSRKNDINI